MQSHPQSLQADSHRRHHPELTEAGRATSRQIKDIITIVICFLALILGYETNQIPGGFLSLTFRLPSTSGIRGSLKKRRRPVALVFVGSPVPMKRDDSSERSALLTMAYFHPWTLRKDDAQEDHVPFAGSLRIIQHGKNILPLA